jgi:hypothetical protein
MSGGSGYFVHVPHDVEAYIRAIDTLPAVMQQQVLDACVQDLEQRADHFLQLYPLAHESYTFEYEYALMDGGLIHSFRFIAAGSNRAVGVVQVVYVEHETISLP